MTTKEELIAKLREAYPDVQSVEIAYEGSGDEGSVGEITLQSGESGISVETENDALFAELAEFVEEALGDKLGCWADNEGGHGTVDFDLKTGRAVILHSHYVTIAEEEEPVEL